MDLTQLLIQKTLELGTITSDI